MAPKAKPAKKTYLIPDIDPKKWQALQIRAAKEGRSIKWLFHTFIETYAAGK